MVALAYLLFLAYVPLLVTLRRIRLSVSLNSAPLRTFGTVTSCLKGLFFPCCMVALSVGLCYVSLAVFCCRCCIHGGLDD